MFQRLIFISIQLMTVLSFAATWKPITSAKRPTCSEIAPCSLVQKKDQHRYKIVFDTMSSVEQPQLQTMKKITISGVDSEFNYYPIENTSGILPGESFQSYRSDINGDGYEDFMLMALSTSKEPLFFYFIYDSTEHQFVMNDRVLPELRLSKSGILYSVHGQAFKLDASKQIRRVK